MRLVTWNVRSLRDDRTALLRVLHVLRPDVLFVQEAPRFFRAQSKLAALAREAGLVVAAGGKSAAGVALLTQLRVNVDAPRSQLLSKTEGMHQRGVASAHMKLHDLSFLAASIHLGLEAGERARHAQEVLQLVDMPEARVPLVLAGDFNERSDGTAWQLLASDRQDPGLEPNEPTFSSANPRRRIDAILVPSEWSARFVSPLEIVDESDLIAATDHRPVIIDVME